MLYFEGKNSAITSSSWTINIMMSVSSSNFFSFNFYSFVLPFQSPESHPDAMITARNGAAADGESSTPESRIQHIAQNSQFL